MRGDLGAVQRMRLGGRGSVLGGDRRVFVILGRISKAVGTDKNDWIWHLYLLLRVSMASHIYGGLIEAGASFLVGRSLAL